MSPLNQMGHIVGGKILTYIEALAETIMVMIIIISNTIIIIRILMIMGVNIFASHFAIQYIKQMLESKFYQF